MSNEKPLYAPTDGRLALFQEFLKHPLQIGSVISSSRFLSIEINPHLHTLVSRIEDGRLIAHRGDANGLKEILSMYGLGAPEVPISGIPFSTMSRCSGSQIIEAIWSVLAPGGRFVAYQVSKRVACLCQPILGPGQMEVKLFNIPPLRVYRWKKNRA